MLSNERKHFSTQWLSFQSLVSIIFGRFGRYLWIFYEKLQMNFISCLWALRSFQNFLKKSPRKYPHPSHVQARLNYLKLGWINQKDQPGAKTHNNSNQKQISKAFLCHNCRKVPISQVRDLAKWRHPYTKLSSIFPFNLWHNWHKTWSFSVQSLSMFKKLSCKLP